MSGAGGWGGGVGGWRGVVEKILHSDLKISLDETDKLERLGSGEDPPSSLHIVGGKQQKRRRRLRFARSSVAEKAACQRGAV